MENQTLCDEADPTPCLAKDSQEAMEWINNIGVAYLDVGEISIAKAFFVQALRLRAQKTDELTDVLEASTATRHSERTARYPTTTSTTTYSSSSINITVLATQTVISAAKRNRQRVLFATGTVESRPSSSAQPETPLIDFHPFLYDRAFTFTHRNQYFEAVTDESRSPLPATARVIYNLGLTLHILGLMNASQHREMTHRAQLLYEESKSLLDLHSWRGNKHGHETSMCPNLELLRMAIYNNLAHIAFELGEYTTSAALMDRLRPMVSDPSDSDQYKRHFLLNSLLLVPPTVAAVA